MASKSDHGAIASKVCDTVLDWVELLYDARGLRLTLMPGIGLMMASCAVRGTASTRCNSAARYQITDSDTRPMYTIVDSIYM